MTPPTSESDYTQAKLECNVSKNRYMYLNVLPGRLLVVAVLTTKLWSNKFLQMIITVCCFELQGLQDQTTSMLVLLM